MQIAVYDPDVCVLVESRLTVVDEDLAHLVGYDTLYANQTKPYIYIGVI